MLPSNFYNLNDAKNDHNCWYWSSSISISLVRRMLLDWQEGVFSLAQMKNSLGLLLRTAYRSRQNWLTSCRVRKQQQMPIEGSMVFILQVRKEPQKQDYWIQEVSLLAYCTQCGSRQIIDSPLKEPRKQSALPGRPPIMPFEWRRFIISISTLRYFSQGLYRPSRVSTMTPMDSLCWLQLAQTTSLALGLQSHRTTSLPAIMASTIWSKKRLPLLNTRKVNLRVLSRQVWLSSESTWEICEGLYQSPGSIPYSLLAILFIFCMEKGLLLSKSLKRSTTSSISSCRLIILCDLMISAKAIWPTRIMQPQPVSVTQVPLRSWQSWGKPARQVSQGVLANRWKRRAFCYSTLNLSICILSPSRQTESPAFTRLSLSSDSIMPITRQRMLKPAFHIFSKGVRLRVSCDMRIYYAARSGYKLIGGGA